MDWPSLRFARRTRGLRLFLALAGLLSFADTAALGQQVMSQDCDTYVFGPSSAQRGMPTRATVSIDVPDWHKLKSADYLQSVLDIAFREATATCRRKWPDNPIGKIELTVQDSQERFGPRPITASRSFEGSWMVNKDGIAQLEEREREAEEARRAQEAEAKRKAEEAVAQEKRKQQAGTECVGGPKLSGGPWFSSTYSVAARDEIERASRSDFFCIKSVEYVSPAPNPFGGNAARARFTGFSRDQYVPLAQTRDFAY